MFDVENTIITQYQNSPRITALIKAMNEFIDPGESFDEFYYQAFNIETAIGWGLDNIGRIIGLSRVIVLEQKALLDGEIYIMEDDEEYRNFLYLKAASNLTDCSIPSINGFLQWLFEDRGMIYVREKAPMVIEYVFKFELGMRERALLEASGLIPRPAGVGFGVKERPPNFFFGFWIEDAAIYEQPYRGFSQPDGSGVFYPEEE
jgi:hypothetical protein